jgi:2,3-bisphosphoglycerate-independent phosphoglycerate mutase
MKFNSKFVCLVVLDGWGIASPGPGNAISQAKTINFNRFWASFPHTQLLASGEAVGLPRSEAGNTETGHLNLGAGRIVYQDLERINMAIANGTFFKNPVFLGAMKHVKENSSNLHIMGLVGASGIHSNLEHLFALIQACAQQGLNNNVFVHLFTDGRDSPPTASIEYVKKVGENLMQEGVGQIASIMGRYWAMDRDRRWDRTAKAYFALTKGEGLPVKTPEEAIEISYKDGKTDEFIEPAVITDQAGKPIVLIKDNDAVIFFNFRIDRPRQLTSAFVVQDFNDRSLLLDFDPYLEKYEKTHLISKIEKQQKLFDRGQILKNLFFVTMTEYSQSLVTAGTKVAYGPEHVDMPIGRVLSENNLKQLKMAESEKERFVTYYFNGLREEAFIGEERLIIPSPQIATYDLKPEMSAYEITDSLISKLKEPFDFSFVLVNFANPDMVAHTGSIGPAVKACEVLDECLGKISNSVEALGGTLLITGDHGNCEEMINNQTGQIDTEHNGNPVPFIVVSKDLLGRGQTLQSGILADVAPTILSILGIQKPSSMTGRDLLSGF